MHDLLEGLNSAQREAVEHRGGPLLVLAGPGSGKTRVITARIVQRVQTGVPPHRILGITFTQRAATEMRERVRVELHSSDVRLGTFHWACHAIVRRYAAYLGYTRQPRLLAPNEARSVLGQVTQDEGFAVPPRSTAAAVSAIKNGMSITDAAHHHSISENRLSTLLTHYNRRLLSLGCLDLDDLLTMAVRLLQEHPDLRDICRSAYEEILVDEYQDTNPVQQDLLTLLLPPSRSLVAVGDADQAIYSWRQASSRAILGFVEAFAPADVVRLEQNYRSTKFIVRAAETLICHNKSRLDFSLRTDNSAGVMPECYVAQDERDEARWIAAQIAGLLQEGNIRPGDCAVLYRTNSQSRALEDALIEASIPYQVLSGRRFYDRPEVRATLAYLRLALDSSDSEALLHLAAGIPGIGERRLALLAADVAERHSAVDSLTNEDVMRLMPAAVRIRLAGLRERVQHVVSLRNRPVLDLLGYAIEATLVEIGEKGTADVEAMLDNLEELRTLVQESGRRMTLRQLVDRLTIDAPSEEKRSDVVQLASLHAAKGTEFEVVCLAGLEEGLLPHRRSLERDEDIEEERRLCYVGMTRAKRRLFLSYAHARLLAGQALIGSPSRFLDDVGTANFILKTSSQIANRPRLYRVKVGERVFHQRWKEGTVVKVEGKGREMLVTIEFDDGKRQRLQLCYAPLKQVVRGSCHVAR